MGDAAGPSGNLGQPGFAPGRMRALDEVDVRRACSGFYEAVVEGTITHSGDRRLSKHVANAVLRTDSRGARIVKESKHSKRRIDLAVAAVMAHSRAVELARRPAPSIYVG
jgi:phage terminase large subunit-like protein